MSTEIKFCTLIIRSYTSRVNLQTFVTGALVKKETKITVVKRDRAYVSADCLLVAHSTRAQFDKEQITNLFGNFKQSKVDVFMAVFSLSLHVVVREVVVVFLDQTQIVKNLNVQTTGKRTCQRASTLLASL